MIKFHLNFFSYNPNRDAQGLLSWSDNLDVEFTVG